MDRLDRRILEIYQRDTRRIAEAIGAEVGLSAAAVQRRLKRLRAAGVIASEIALLDGRAIGVPITCIVTVSLASGAAQIDRFKREMQAQPQVQQCYHVTGSTDLVLVVVAGSMEAYGEFVRTWFESGPQVARYETHVVLDRVKVGLTLPVPLDESTEGRMPIASRRNDHGAS